MTGNHDERLVRIAELEIEPAHVDSYVVLLRAEIEASLAREPGVLLLQAVSLKESPGSIRLLEVYASRADYESHIQTPHFLTYKRLTADMVTSLTLIDVTPLALDMPERLP